MGGGGEGRMKEKLKCRFGFYIKEGEKEEGGLK